MQLERLHANYSQYTTHTPSSGAWLNGTWYSILNYSASQSVISKMAQTQHCLWNHKTKFNATITGKGISFHGSPVAQCAENLKCDRLCLSFLLIKFFCLVSTRNLIPISQKLWANLNYIIFSSYGTVIFLLFVVLALGWGFFVSFLKQ